VSASRASRSDGRQVAFGGPPGRRPPFKGVTTRSFHVPMRDGTRIAIDAMLPRTAPPDSTFPTILFVARYWRSFALRGIAPRHRAPIGPRWWLPDFLTSHGYAVVAVDTRGSGASTGTTDHPFSEQELQDYGEVVDWIVGQPWSDGTVGATGISYEGIAAELLTVAHPAATKVVIPQQADIDQYAEFLLPGGILNEPFVEGWQATNDALDANRVPDAFGRLAKLQIKGVRPVDDDRDAALLRQATAEHAGNADIAAYARGVTFRDDPFGPSGITMDDFSAVRYREPIERSGAAIFSWGSWLDGSTADGVIRRFATYPNPQWATIGAWSHGYRNHGSPYRATKAGLRPRRKQLWQEMVAYFDHYLKGSEDPGYAENKLFYFTMGEEAWKVTATWPPAGSTTQRWYLAGNNMLSREAPAGEHGADPYTVDFDATTGRTNRWYTQDGVTKVVYDDRAEADERLLTYTGPVLAEDVEITGHPVVTLYVASTADDGAFHVYLEDVAPDGRVIYLTEGQLRAIHRKISTAEPAFELFVPHHSYLREDSRPLIPGEVAELRFGLLPVSALVRAGHRLRVAIAGADRDTFVRIPAEGTPTITVHRDLVHSSHVELPVIGA
jgi:uncharacterized protein